MPTTEDPDHPDLNKPGPDGQNRVYLVLPEKDRKLGRVEPYRASYTHLACKTATTIGMGIAETYAANPKFYNATFCVRCGKHFPLVVDDQHQFEWEDGVPVGMSIAEYNELHNLTPQKPPELTAAVAATVATVHVPESKQGIPKAAPIPATNEVAVETPAPVKESKESKEGKEGKEGRGKK